MSVCGGCGCCLSFYRVFYGFLPDTIHHIPKNNLKCMLIVLINYSKVNTLLLLCFSTFITSISVCCSRIPIFKEIWEIEIFASCRLCINLLVRNVLYINIQCFRFGSLFCQIYLFLPHFVLDVTYLLVLAALIIFSYVFKMYL